MGQATCTRNLQICPHGVHVACNAKIRPIYKRKSIRIKPLWWLTLCLLRTHPFYRTHSFVEIEVSLMMMMMMMMVLNLNFWRLVIMWFNLERLFIGSNNDTLNSMSFDGLLTTLMDLLCSNRALDVEVLPKWDIVYPTHQAYSSSKKNVRWIKSTLHKIKTKKTSNFKWFYISKNLQVPV